MRLAIAVVTLLALAAAPAAAQDTYDDLRPVIEALQSDSVYVAPGVDVDAGELREQIADRGLDVNIAVMPDGADPVRVAPRLHEFAGEEGVTAVLAGTRLIAGPGDAAREAAAEAAEQNRGESPATVLRDFVARLDDGGGADGGIGAGGLILLGLAGAGGAAFVISRRQRRRQAAVELAEVKDNVRDDLVALGEDIRALEIDMDMPAASDAAKADYETAVGAYERADSSWRLAQRLDDLEPVGAALEEGRWAMSSARARLEGREPPERRSPCFFDPRHGPSDRDVEWTPAGGAPRMVPACEADAQRVERGEEPRAREVTVGGERMPYWSAGPAFAPFMGGYFGAGILPGLMIGTMLGDAWHAPDTGGGGDWGGGDFGGGDFGGGDFGG